jgi:hypothetical protein
VELKRPITAPRKTNTLHLPDDQEWYHPAPPPFYLPDIPFIYICLHKTTTASPHAQLVVLFYFIENRFYYSFRIFRNDKYTNVDIMVLPPPPNGLVVVRSRKEPPLCGAAPSSAEKAGGDLRLIDATNCEQWHRESSPVGGSLIKLFSP